MKHLDLFSGIGGFALAASWVWGDEYENVGHCEIEEYACKVYHRHFPTSPHLGDITKVKWHEGQADIITGGFPCQPHSANGLRLASQDERDLWYQCKRAIGEIRPRYALFENVSGLLTSERGRFFNRVLSDLAEIGYNAEWFVIPASSVGFAHQRERVWIVSHTNENGFDEIEIQNRITQSNKGLSIKHRSPINQAMGGVSDSLIRGEVNGIPRWVDRLAGLGNAIVPQVAQVILQAIKEADECTI